MDERQSVRKHYARALQTSCCEPSAGCCETVNDGMLETATLHGYSENDLNTEAAEAFLGFGCGNPTAIANLKEGETVLDLGCGAGFDVFLAADRVGPDGKAIGVDMTAEMLHRARNIAQEQNVDNVQFRLGEIEHIPMGDETVDVVISNCVINLSPCKESVFAEIYRVLKPGGRVAISDILKKTRLPQEMKDALSGQCNCVTGAMTTGEAHSIMQQAGLKDINIVPEEDSGEIVEDWSQEFDLSDVIYSARITARKAAGEHV